MNSNRTDANFAPAANVTKGICQINGGSGNCKTSTSACQLNSFSIDPTAASKQLVRLPRDTNIQSDGNNGTVRFGNATWSASTYWAANHPGVSYPSGSLGSTPTRYAVYRYEIDNALIPNKSGGSGENGGPICSSQTPINTPNRDRRTLIMSVVNCKASGLHGSQSNVPVVAYVKMFVTEPMGLDASGGTSSGNVNNIYGEVEGVIKPGDVTGTLHQSPLLYR
jgi:hypothetical protein